MQVKTMFYRIRSRINTILFTRASVTRYNQRYERIEYLTARGGWGNQKHGVLYPYITAFLIVKMFQIMKRFNY